MITALIEMEISILISNSYMDTLEKAELTAWICQIRTFLKLEIHIYNPEVPDHYGIGEKRV